MEAMTTLDYPWDDMHHLSYFLCNKLMIKMLWSPKNSFMVRLIGSITPNFEPMNSNHIHLVAITLPHDVWVRGHPLLRV